MALSIKPTSVVTGRQVKEILDRMDRRDGYGKDELFFPVIRKETIKKIKQLARWEKESQKSNFMVGGKQPISHYINHYGGF